MLYEIKKTDLGLTLECVDAGQDSNKIGWRGPRLIRGSKNTSVLELLDKLWFHGHASFKVLIEGEEVNALTWKNLEEEDLFIQDEESEEKRLADIDIVISSDLDVLTLVGFSTNACIHPVRKKRKVNETERFSKPTSKKAVQALVGWLY